MSSGHRCARACRHPLQQGRNVYCWQWATEQEALQKITTGLFDESLLRLGFLAEGFWPQAERLSYYVLVPCLFFHSLATAKLDALPARELTLFLKQSRRLSSAATL
mgnify:CR=1 FL=1